MQGGMGAPMGGMGYPPSGNAPPTGGSVVIVNKLDQTKVTPDVLFGLFGVYGDVQRVKILYNKRDTAMIQFATTQQATNAVANLSGCSLFGNEIMVNKSKHTDVKLPREDTNDGQELTKDFSGHNAHRFKRTPFINQKNVHPPSQVLHVANIHENATEAELMDLFASQQPGSQAPVIEFFQKSNATAYLCMNSVEDSITAVINLHNHNLHGYNMRVSFSGKDPSSINPQGKSS